MGAIAALPLMGKLALGAIGGAAASKFLGGSEQPPPTITNLSENQQISNQYKPINFSSIIDQLSGDKLDIVRGVDGKMSLTFANNRSSNNRLMLDAPATLPVVRQITGRNIDQRASEVIALSAAMTRLGQAIETLETTSPYLIPQNQELITRYRTAVNGALERGFDFKQNAIEQRLTKMGLANSSTAIGVQIALAREKANAYAESELKEAELAQGLKQQAIANLNTRGQLLNSQANTELNRFATETSNQLQMRQQDMQADLATESLNQQKALSEAQIVENRRNNAIDLQENRRIRMMELGLGAFNSGNQQAQNARQIDNNRIANDNQSQYQRYSMTSDPAREMMGTFVGSTLGAVGQGLGSRMINSFLPDDNKRRR